MNSTPSKQQVSKLLADFDREMDTLRHRFHAILKSYESKRINHLKDIISHFKSL